MLWIEGADLSADISPLVTVLNQQHLEGKRSTYRFSVSLDWDITAAYNLDKIHEKD